MDDNAFKKELLSRLDQIAELLTSLLPEACLEEPQEKATTGEVDGDGQPAPALPRSRYLIGDEMQEDYHTALQRWKQEKDNGKLA